jgi:hypothetical protein
MSQGAATRAGAGVIEVHLVERDLAEGRACSGWVSRGPTMGAMDNASPRSVRPIVQAAALLLVDLTVLMAVSVSISTGNDKDVSTDSATPFTDGTITAVLVAMALVLVNGVLLCFSPNTRRIGIGAVIAAVASVPVGLAVGAVGLLNVTY